MNQEPIDAEWQPVPAREPVERVARALCRYDQKDPDAIVDSGSKEPTFDKDGIATLKPTGVPAWKRYTEEAARLVVAIRAFYGT